MFNNDIITFSILFTSTFRFIIRFMINKVFKFIFITKSFEIMKLYRNFIFFEFDFFFEFSLFLFDFEYREFRISYFEIWMF